MKKSFKEVALAAAYAAGELQLKFFKSGVKAKKKSSSFDLVTVADLESEKTIVKIIKKSFPEHNVLAEENRYKRKKSVYCWIIDPLDGTNNFSFGFPFFCISIALAKDGQVILGLVYDPLRKELFWAEKRKGAYLNGKKIKVSAVDSLKESLLITGFYYDRGKAMLDNLEIIKWLFQKNIIGLRRLGAAALDLAYIACGRATGFWEFSLNPWDFAAGKLLVEEAGGKTSNNFGVKLELKKSYVLASNGKIHTKIIEAVNSLGNGKN